MAGERTGYDGQVRVPAAQPAGRDLAARLALGAALAALVAVPFVFLLLLVESEWEPLERLDRSTADSLNDYGRSHAWLVHAGDVGEVVLDPWVYRVVILVVAVWLWRRGARRLATWAVVTVAVGGTLVGVLKLLVARARPEFPEPVAHSPGYSFPSGHASGSVLCLGVLLIIFWPAMSASRRRTAVLLGVVIVLLTGFDRVALGVHFVSDVVAGWLVATAVLLATTASFGWWRRSRGQPFAGGTEGRVRQAAVVYNPTKVSAPELLRRRVDAFMSAHGWAEPVWLPTTVDDPGSGMCRTAVGQKCDVVFVAGGDGTLMAAVTAMAGCGVPLAVLPIGTGNLLARNLGLPLDEETCLRIGISGRTRTIDVGAVGDRKFAVMAGLGFDAAMMRDAPEGLKKAVGWPAYVVSGAKHLRGHGIRITLTLDDAPPLHRRVTTVVVGNVGRLQGNIPLLPDAKPDDGVLDVVVIASHTVADWARVTGRVIRRANVPDRRIERFTARHVVIEASRPQPRQLDGDVIEEDRTMDITVEPGALLVKVP